jgi:hypothetical protein
MPEDAGCPSDNAMTEQILGNIYLAFSMLHKLQTHRYFAGSAGVARYGQVIPPALLPWSGLDT